MTEIIASKQFENVRFEVYEEEPNAFYQVVKMNLKEPRVEKVIEAHSKFDATVTYYSEICNYLESVALDTPHV